ncbi:MAG: hypothetical protein K2W79_09310 [Hydrotalea flava]|uniref:hypothetical protein n=1 Tax=Hydrotalea TaxID=1004300 RepID=UPI000942D1C8|nr:MULTISPECIES: hypothetical protein [Hydrotalea]MBY0348446.1 hypothetical protein [Hydrotalea flava]RWZ90294.1 MAG: hypothetical protein EO766_02475 [Hydrotalea sp. AMD]
MKSIQQLITFILIFIFLVGCQTHPGDLSGTKPVSSSDFFAAFPPIGLPITIADTNINSFADTTVIGIKAMSQFIPDSILNHFHLNKKAIIHPVGSIQKLKEKYILANFSYKNNTILGVFVFNEKNEFLAAKNLVQSKQNDGYVHSVYINKEPTFLISREKYTADKKLLYTRTGWVYNNGNAFMVAMNDGNEDELKNNTIINPIDTLPEKNKHSGNYAKNSKNFIAIRDGKTPKLYHFFIHFENKDNCNGELKGMMKMVGEDKAVYKEIGEPCSIEFTFKNNEITFKENGKCGNKRGIQCYFDDTYPKQKSHKIIKKKRT